MDITTKSIAERVRDQLAMQFGIEPEERAAKLADGMSLFDDLGCDSLDCVEIVIRAEEEFGFEISDAEAEEIVTIRDFIKYIEDRH